jgi:uncharacterized membrane protein
MIKFYIVITLAIVQFIVCSSLILVYRKSKEPKHEGIVYSCILGVGLSFAYAMEVFANL